MMITYQQQALLAIIQCGGWAWTICAYGMAWTLLGRVNTKELRQSIHYRAARYIGTIWLLIFAITVCTYWFLATQQVDNGIFIVQAGFTLACIHANHRVFHDLKVLMIRPNMDTISYRDIDR